MSAFAPAISELVESPPPYPPFCHGRAGFRRSFASVALSRLEARPSLVVHALFAHGREWPRAAYRLLQPMRSASTTTVARTPQDHTSGRPLVQLCFLAVEPEACAPNSGCPSLRPSSREPELSLRRPTRLSASGLAADGRATFVERPVEVSRVRGLRRRLVLPLSMTPPTATARGERFAPTRSARTPPVAGS